MSAGCGAILRNAAEEARTEALGVAAREIMKQATLGFQDALDDTRRDRASGEMPQADGALLGLLDEAETTRSP